MKFRRSIYKTQNEKSKQVVQDYDQSLKVYILQNDLILEKKLTAALM